MLKEALEYIVNLDKTVNLHTITTMDGRKDIYADKHLYRVDPFNPKAEEICISTLRGLVDYLKSDENFLGDVAYVLVESPTEVSVFTNLDDERKREHVAHVKAKVPGFQFGKFMLSEEFLIGVQANFLPSENRDLVLKFAGSVEVGTVTDYGDDGITQKATIRDGLASKIDAKVPNPVTLAPFRTFVEVEQPASDFVFRMSSEGSYVQCALFEADGGIWKLEAMENVKRYLSEKLLDVENVVVLA